MHASIKYKCWNLCSSCSNPCYRSRTYVEIIVSNRQYASRDLKSLIRTVTNRNVIFAFQNLYFHSFVLELYVYACSLIGSFEFFHNKLLMDSLNLMAKKKDSWSKDLFSWNQCAGHETMAQSVIAHLLNSEFVESASWIRKTQLIRRWTL